MADPWYVYVLVSEETGRTYVGITIDPDRRLQEHNGTLPNGAKATRPWRPWKIGRLHGPITNRSEAAILEHRIKQETGNSRLLVEWEPSD